MSLTLSLALRLYCALMQMYPSPLGFLSPTCIPTNFSEHSRALSPLMCELCNGAVSEAMCRDGNFHRNSRVITRARGKPQFTPRITRVLDLGQSRPLGSQN